MPRVLVVEDNAAEAEQFRLLLEGAGCEVLLAANGQEALGLLRNDVPDVVFTDLDMPVMNGLDLVRAARRDHPALPIILLTATGCGEAAVRALHEGAAGYVRKTNLAREIVHVLGHVLSIVRALPSQTRVFDCLSYDQVGFVLDNDPALVPPLIGYLEEVAAILHPCQRAERVRVGLALHEALLNAIQHGNLELSTDLRQQSEQAFQGLGEQRRRQPPYSDRRVRVQATLSREEAVYVVEDQGPGFDPSALPDPTDPSNLERVGGRGLTLMRAFMSQVDHNAKGNRVTMRKSYLPVALPGTDAR